DGRRKVELCSARASRAPTVTRTSIERDDRSSYRSRIGRCSRGSMIRRATTSIAFAACLGLDACGTFLTRAANQPEGPEPKSHYSAFGSYPLSGIASDFVLMFDRDEWGDGKVMGIFWSLPFDVFFDAVFL